MINRICKEYILKTDKKYLRLWIENYTFATLEELHNEHAYKELKANELIKTSKLYSIIKTEEITFDIDSFVINNKYDISCNIIIKNKKKPITFNLLEVYYDSLKDKFANINDLQEELEYIILNQFTFPDGMKVTKEKYIYINLSS